MALLSSALGLTAPADAPAKPNAALFAPVVFAWALPRVFCAAAYPGCASLAAAFVPAIPCCCCELTGATNSPPYC